MRKTQKSTELNYLRKPPIMLRYVVVAGPKVEDIQLRDVIFDEYDLRIRKLDTQDNLIYLREVQK